MEVNPLVFETSASTNSAIWAFGGAKIRHLFYFSRSIAKKFATWLLIFQFVGGFCAGIGSAAGTGSKVLKKNDTFVLSSEARQS
jgi:hypothetical protein